MASQWFYTKNGEQHGPVSSSQLRKLARSGQLAQTDLVWKQGVDDWRPARVVKGLFKKSSAEEFPINSLDEESTRENESSEDWYYSDRGSLQGPIRLDELKEMVEHGELRKKDLVWKKGFPKWEQVKNVDELTAFQKQVFRKSDFGHPGQTANNIKETLANLGTRIVGSFRRFFQWVSVVVRRRWIEHQLKKLASTRDALLVEASFALLTDSRSAIVFSEEIAGMDRLQKKLAASESKRHSLKQTESLRSEIKSVEKEIESTHDSIFELRKRIAAEGKKRNMLEKSQQDRLESIASSLESSRSEFEQLSSFYRQQQFAFREVILPVVFFVLVAGYLGYSFILRTPNANLIVSTEDEAALEQAVVKVVCGIQVIQFNGKKTVAAKSYGTGFFISSDGFLLTNRHVIEETYQWKGSPGLKRAERELHVEITPMFWIFAGGEKYEAEIVHLSDEYDLCILKVDRESGSFFSLSSEEGFARNQNIFAFGFPVAANMAFDTRQILDERYLKEMRTDKIEDYIKESDFVFTSTVGVISRVRKDKDSPVLIQTDCVITPGNSGGPLLLHDGTVIGVNTLYNPEKSGYYWALATFQIREEIDQHVPNVVWR